MDDKELLAKIRDNIFMLSASMMDAPYFGFSGDKIKGVNFAIDEILKNTGITLEEIIKEGYKNNTIK